MYLFFLSLLLFFNSVCAQQICIADVHDLVELNKVLPISFVLKKISYSADIPFNDQEFYYLVDLKEGATHCPIEIERAARYLLLKQKIEKVCIELSVEADGVSLHFALGGRWTLGKVKVKGIWVGKEWYSQYYLIEAGEGFDKDKHEHSIVTIKNKLRNEGYFNAAVSSSFEYDEALKNVYVTITINRATRFAIKENAVVIDGNDNGQPVVDYLYKMFKHHLKGGRYNKKAIEEQAEAVRRYLMQKGYLQASIELEERIFHKVSAVNLVWRITLGHKRDLIFFGNRFFTDKQLVETICQFGRSTWLLPASFLAQEITKKYKDKGFWDVEVTTQEEGDRSFFVVREGKRAKIKQVQIEGVTYFSPKHIHSYSKKIVQRSFFDIELVNELYDELTSLYLKHGFLQVKIGEHHWVPHTDMGHILVVPVDEGVQSKIDTIVIPGFSTYQKQGPFLEFQKKVKPVAYDFICLQEQKQWLTKQLHQEGYLNCKISSQISQRENESTLIWNVDQGEHVEFGKTVINANGSVAYPTMMKELLFEEKQQWEQHKLKQSFLRLKEAGVFNSISLTPVDWYQDNVRPVVVKVQKDDPFELRIRSGIEFQNIRQYQTFGGLAYRVGGTFMVKNMTNHLDLARFDADVAQAHRHVRFKYYYPWLFNTPLHAVAQAYAIKYDQPGFIGSSTNLYTIFQHGFLTGIRYRNMWADVGLNLGFEVARTRIAKDDALTRQEAALVAQAIDFNPALLNKRVPFLFCEPTVLFDCLDNNLNPTKGIFSLLSLKGMFPTNETFANAYFVKVLAECSWFIPIESIVAAFRIRLGHIFHRVFEDIMPSERFYLGGAHSIRSYQSDLAPPLGCFIDRENKKRIVPRGGKTMFNANVELRIPTFTNVSLVLFQDLGLLSGDDLVDCKAENVAVGTGLGIRYLTPIGPVRFDVAWKWNRHPLDDCRYNWFLTIGQAF